MDLAYSDSECLNYFNKIFVYFKKNTDLHKKKYYRNLNSENAYDSKGRLGSPKGPRTVFMKDCP